MKILLSSGRAPASLELARLFFYQGHEVFIADSFGIHLSMHSRAIKKCFRLPPPRQELEQYTKSINKIILEEKIDLLVPVYEESFHVSRIKNEIKGCPVFVENIDKLRTLHHKGNFIRYCQTIGLNVPKTLEIKSLEELKKLDINPRNCVLKPSFSRYGEEVVISPESFDLEINISKEYSWVIQEKITGKLYCTYSICYQGKVLCLSIYPSETTLKNTVCLNFKQVENKRIEEWVINFVEKTKYTGQIGFDFFESNGCAYAIECNPRMTSGIHLFCEQPNIVDCFIYPEKITTMQKPRKGTHYMLGLLLLMYGLCSLKTFKTLIQAKDVIFRKNDIAPFFDQFLCFFYLLFKAVKNNVYLSKATTRDIEWNGENI